jgi:hypothetical protein
MLKTILISVLIVAIGVILLAVKILFSKKGRFPQTHISGNRSMRERGIGCVQSQDREARMTKPWKVSERRRQD